MRFSSGPKIFESSSGKISYTFGDTQRRITREIKPLERAKDIAEEAADCDSEDLVEQTYTLGKALGEGSGIRCLNQSRPCG
jgi:hypothetical protein